MVMEEPTAPCKFSDLRVAVAAAAAAASAASSCSRAKSTASTTTLAASSARSSAVASSEAMPAGVLSFWARLGFGVLPAAAGFCTAPADSLAWRV